MLFSVVLPAYNEAENLNLLIPEICLQMAGTTFEVIVVDDDSPDNTQQVVQDFIDQKFPLKLIIRKKDRGFANSIRAGIESSQSEYVIIMDSDGNHSPKYLPFMCENIKFYPCVVASRFQYGGGMDGYFRQIFSWIFNVFVRSISGNYITDSLFGYIVVKRDILMELDFDKIFWGYGDYCIRLLFYLQRINVPILQFPARNGERRFGQGNSKLVKVFWQYLTESIILIFKERILNAKRP